MKYTFTASAVSIRVQGPVGVVVQHTVGCINENISKLGLYNNLLLPAANVVRNIGWSISNDVVGNRRGAYGRLFGN